MACVEPYLQTLAVDFRNTGQETSMGACQRFH